MERLIYRGYCIEAVPYQLDGSTGWRIRVFISRGTESAASTRSFFACNAFTSKTEAMGHCFRFGREIVEGKYPGCSLDDL